MNSRRRSAWIIALATAASVLALSLAPSSAAPIVAVAPTNDNFLHPLKLNSPGTALNSFVDIKDNAGATTQPNLFSPCPQGACGVGPPEMTRCKGVPYTNTVWYRFYPDQDGQAEIRTFGIQNVISLYTLDPQKQVPDFRQCAPGSNSASNELFWKVRQGLAYTFQVGGRDGVTGSFKMQFNYASSSDLTVARFRARAVLQTVAGRPRKLKLLRLQLVGLTRGERVSYACASCTSGYSPIGTSLGTSIVLRAKPAPLLSARTRFLVAASAPARIGRFKLYAIDVGTRHPYSLIMQGCLPPGITSVTEAEVTRLSLLRRQACPTPTVNFAGGEYVFWESPSGHLQEKRYSDGQWQITGTPIGARLDSGPAVSVHSNGEQEVFWKGRNGLLSESWYTSKWNGPSQFRGARPNTAPTAGVDLQGDEDVFWQGTDDGLFQMTFDNGHPSQPLEIDQAGRQLGSAPAVAVHANGQQDVFWRGTDGNLWEMVYSGVWIGPYKLGGGPLGSGPAVGLDSASNEYVFWRGTDARLWEKQYLHGHWGAPTPINLGQLDSAPTVAVHADGEQDVFWKGTHGHLMEASNTGTWSDAVSLGGGRLGSAPSAAVPGAQGAG